MTDLTLYDNTRLSDWKKCPRYFYFRHVRHWTRIRSADRLKSIHLVFGSAWHEAMDVVWGEAHSEISDAELLDAGMAAFHKSWAEDQWPTDQQELDQLLRYLPKTPMMARETLIEYIDKRRPQIQEMEILAIEKPFVVPLSEDRPNLYYCGRLDKLVKQASGPTTVIEHKTTGKFRAGPVSGGPPAGFRNDYIESWQNNSQCKGYLYDLHMEYGNTAREVWVDAALFHAKDHSKITFIPVTHHFSMLDAWLWETLNWINMIERSLERLEEDKTAGFEYMTAFPKRDDNTCESCGYREVCNAFPNPHQKDTPYDYQIEKWEPVERLGLQDMLKRDDGG